MSKFDGLSFRVEPGVVILDVSCFEALLSFKVDPGVAFLLLNFYEWLLLFVFCLCFDFSSSLALAAFSSSARSAAS